MIATICRVVWAPLLVVFVADVVFGAFSLAAARDTRVLIRWQFDLCNIPRDTGRPVSRDIAEPLKSGWSERAASAEKTAALDRARQLQKLEYVNAIAALAVLAGLAAEVLAIALAAAAVVVAITAE